MSPAPASPAAALQMLPIVRAMHRMPWIYTALASIHLFGVAVLVGGVTLFDLRLLGVNRGIPVRQLARHLLPLAAGALLLIVPTGLLMFTAHALDFLDSTAFLVKMLLIFAAGCHAILFHLGPYRSVTEWDTEASAPWTVRLSAVVSMLTWAAVIVCGRLLVHP